MKYLQINNSPMGAQEYPLTEKVNDNIYIYSMDLNNLTVEGLNVFLDEEPHLQIENCEWISINTAGKDIGYLFDDNNGLYSTKLGSDSGVYASFSDILGISLRSPNPPSNTLFERQGSDSDFKVSDNRLLNLSKYIITSNSNSYALDTLDTNRSYVKFIKDRDSKLNIIELHLFINQDQ